SRRPKREDPRRGRAPDEPRGHRRARGDRGGGEPMNRVILIGNLGADAELKYTNSGQPVASMRLATSEKWQGKDGQQQERTEWHSLTLWGKRAEALAKYLTKGSRIAIQGRIQYREYEDRNGNKRWSTDINVDDIELLGGRDGVQRDGGSRGSASPSNDWGSSSSPHDFAE